MNCPQCHSENAADTRFCGQCGAKLALPPGTPPGLPSGSTRTFQFPSSEFARGTLIAGRFEVIEKLGQGGMGSVYRVHDAKINEEMALKVLVPDVAGDPTASERFKNELKLARRIVHRNVGRMFDFHEADGLLFITMEFVAGEDLKNLIRRAGRLSPERAVEIARQICEGLAEAHRLGVIHRDLKPQNVMLDKDGNARIMDFGIARVLGGSGLTEPGMILGTPDYMTPEQAEGKAADPRSDIYSLGVILYETTTGRLPFQGGSWLAVALKHKTERPADPRTFNAQIPPALGALILKCLEKDPAARFPTAENLRAALEAVFALPDAAGEKPSSTPAPPPAESKPGTVGERIKSIAVLPFKDLSPRRDQDYLCEGLAEELINALAQIRDLSVAARTSSFSFKGKDADIREIGKSLNVGAVLEGSVQKSGDRIRITAQLIGVTDGYHIWSERFDRNLKDIFAVQDEIAMAVVEKLKVGLLESEREKIVKRHTSNEDAYNLYLQGRYYWNRRYRGDMIKAVDFYGRAIAMDRDYAPPYVGIADVFNIFGQWAFIHPRDAFQMSKDALQKAMEIDNQLSELYASLAFMTQGYEWDYAAAEKHYRRSLELNPRNAYAHAWYGLSLAIAGKFEAGEAESRKAIDLEPLFSLFQSTLGLTLGISKQAEKGREEILKGIAQDPDQPMPYLFLGLIYLQKPIVIGKAIEYLEKAAGFGLTFALGWLGLAYGLAGRKADALHIIERLEKIEHERFIPPLKRLGLYLKPGLKPFRALKNKYAAPMLKALVYFGLNKTGEALAEFEKSCRNRDYLLPGILLLSTLGDIPGADALEAQPRFQALRKDVKI